MTAHGEIPGGLRLANPLVAVVWVALFYPERLWPWFEPALALAVFLLGCVVMFTKAAPWASRRPARQALLFFAALEAVYVVSYLYAAAFSGSQPSWADAFELSRYVLLGGFAVYLIRHRDDSVRRATETALTVFVYITLALSLFGAQRFSPFARSDAAEYLTALMFYYLIFFSRSSARLLHAAAAIGVILLAHGHAWPRQDNQYAYWLAKDGVLGASLILLAIAFAAYRLILPMSERRGGAAVFLCALAFLLAGGRFLQSVRLVYLTGFLFAAMHEEAA